MRCSSRKPAMLSSASSPNAAAAVLSLHPCLQQAAGSRQQWWVVGRGGKPRDEKPTETSATAGPNLQDPHRNPSTHPTRHLSPPDYATDARFMGTGRNHFASRPAARRQVAPWEQAPPPLPQQKGNAARPPIRASHSWRVARFASPPPWRFGPAAHRFSPPPPLERSPRRTLRSTGPSVNAKQGAGRQQQVSLGRPRSSLAGRTFQTDDGHHAACIRCRSPSWRPRRRRARAAATPRCSSRTCGSSRW